jgi:ATP/maltotriose-dependent transcriptional regulator MalT
LYAERSGDPATAAYADEAAVLLAVCRENAAAVVAAAHRVRATPERGPRREMGLFWWPIHLVSALVKLGSVDEAEAELTVATRHARPGETRTAAGIARVRGQLAAARQDLDQARACFTQATAAADDHVDALEQAQALEAYGRFLRRRGERRAAIGQLQDARARYQALRAAPFVRRCDTELAACGVQDPAASTALDPLTPQERAVATLICDGMTNRQAAEALVLSVKTIGYHLANVYTKLGVHSRSQLIGAMRER